MNVLAHTPKGDRASWQTLPPRKDKDGNIISYQIRVFRGRDASSKRLKDYIMTWKPVPGMTKRQIEKELTRQATLFEENCKRGNVSAERYTFQEYTEYALAVKIRGGMKAKTVSSYRDLLTRINAEIGPLKLQDIRPDHLNRYYAKLAEPGQNKRTGEPLSPKTIREHHRVISSILSLVVKEGLIPTNAAQRAMPPKVPKHEMEVFEPEEVQAILKALEDEPMKWRVITTLLIATGARRGEIMGLRWENVDWDNKRLGHAQTSTTLNVYSHVLAKSDERASDTLDDLIFKPNKPQDEPQSR